MRETSHATRSPSSRPAVASTKGTLRRYEEWGLLEPVRAGQRRLYSEADIEHVQRIRRLVDDLGINLAGAAAVMHLRQQVIALQRELDELREQFGE